VETYIIKMSAMQHRIELIKLLPINSIGVEVGVAQGLFSSELLQNGVGVLYSVDNWQYIPEVTGDGNFPKEFHDKNYAEAIQRLSKYGDRSIVLKGMSIEMASKIPDNSLDFVYLDGAHYYSGVMDDLNAYYPKLKSGGVMAGHDWLNIEDYGVNKAVCEFSIKHGISEIFTIPENNINDASFYFIKP